MENKSPLGGGLFLGIGPEKMQKLLSKQLSTGNYNRQNIARCLQPWICDWITVQQEAR
jgi:hypothetical protein